MRIVVLVACCVLLSSCADISFHQAYSSTETGVYIPPGTCSKQSRFLVAQGDSWFSYAPPGNLVLNDTGDVTSDLMNPLVDDKDHFCVLSVATAGKTLKEMNSDSELKRVDFAFAELASQNLPLEAVLLSGGGNDAQPKFPTFFRQFNSKWLELSDSYVLAHVNEFADEDALNGFVSETADAFVEQANAIFKLQRKHFKDVSPILMHGYDYPIPDGSAPGAAWAYFLGPWLQPGFNTHGYTLRAVRDMSRRTDGDLRRLHLATVLTRVFLDRYNEALIATIGRGDRLDGKVVFVDVRNSILPTDKAPFSMHADWRWASHSLYLTDWQNEMHPARCGFANVTFKFIDRLNALHGVAEVPPEKKSVESCANSEAIAVRH